MSNPGSGGDWPQSYPPQQPQQGWGAQPQGGPGYPQPHYEQPQYPGQQYQQPQPGWEQQQYQQGGYAPGQYPQTAQLPMGQFGEQPPSVPPQRKRRTGLIIGAIVAVIALAGGTTAAVWALRDSAAGAASPTEAAMKLLTAVSSNDMVGLLDGLAPAEAALSRDYLEETFKEYKRLEVLKSEADPRKFTGIEVKIEGLKFDEAGTQHVNDHLAITKLTEGKITINGDLTKLPLTDKFMKLIEENVDKPQNSETFDIGEQVRKSGKPIRIATIKVDGEWYPSLFHTIADYALAEEKEQWPSSSIPANGGGSPEQALQDLVGAATKADLRRVIELTAPDEMAVLHDVGILLAEELGMPSKMPDITIKELKTSKNDVTGGVELSLDKITVEVEGEEISVQRDGDCVQVSSGPNGRQKMCAKDIEEQAMSSDDVPPQLQGMIERLVKGFLGAGVVMVEVNDKWYLSPGRTVNELMLTVLRSMQPKDIEELIKLGR